MHLITLNPRYNLRPESRPRTPAAWLGLFSQLLILSVCLRAVPSLADENAYLTPGHPDGIAILPPPPAIGSEEEQADLASARAVFHGRTPAEQARAFKDATLSFELFKPAIGPAFRLNELPKTAALLQRVKKEVREVIDIPKEHWKRRRPYQLDSKLSLGEPETSFSYPSGHSTRGTVYSLVLTELFPDQRAAILEVGREIGWDRVLIGKHYPTDVYAGRVLGRAIMRELRTSAAFQRDLAEARAEIQAARSPALAAPAEKN